MVKIRKFTNIKGILADIDGTLYFKGNSIPGAIETLKKLRQIGLKFLFFTNTDSKSPQTVLKILHDYGFTINKDEIFTPIIALKEFLSKHPNKTSFFVTTQEVEREFQDFRIIKGSEIPDFVIIGDFHDNWDVNRLNKAFKFIIKGAKLLGTQGNNAANVDPEIFGKPSKEYFLQALKRIDLKSDEVLVIGDDLETDIHGAINAGIKGILVKTGKGQYYKSNNSRKNPSMVINSFSSLIDFF
jgi:ribonucleotide monophosphatase NagD (HAD superfamily)